VLCLVSVLGLAALQYATPDTFNNRFGVDHPGVHHFQRVVLGHPSPGIALFSYVAWLRLLLACAWLGYGAALIAGIQGAAVPSRVVLAGATGASILLALFCPPSFSLDSYLYVAFARMRVEHGINPYVNTMAQMAAAGEPLREYLGPSGYGSVWTAFTIALYVATRYAGIWWQVVAVKMVASAALISSSLIGRRIADRLSTGRGDLTLLSIALNPLFLLEGPGNGHNDFAMFVLLLGSLLLCMSARYVAGVLVLGFSLGIKFVTGAILPWLLLDRVRGQGWKRGPGLAVVTGIVALGPVVLLFAPFWDGPHTLVGLLHHSVRGAEPAAGGVVAPARSSAHGQLAILLPRLVSTAVVYAGLTIWLWLRPGGGRILTAWVLLASWLAFATGNTYPWYFVWPLMVSLLRWEPPQTRLSALILGLACGFTYLYTVPTPVGVP
jgi:hypothetical protein